MIDISLAIKSAEDLDKAVGCIASLIGKLKAKPDLAAQKLGQALSEVAKTLQAVDSATSEFLSLGIDEGALDKDSKLLLEIDGGCLSTEVRRGGGHCHVIAEIHRKYLDKWFQKALHGEEYDSMKDVFTRLGEADLRLFEDLENITLTLQAEAGAVLELVLQGQKAVARDRILSVLPALRPLRKTISRTMQSIYSMEGEFLDITSAV